MNKQGILNRNIAMRGVFKKILEFCRNRFLRLIHWRRLFRPTYNKKLIGFIIAAVVLVWFWQCLPNPLFNVPISTIIEDRNGVLLAATIASDEQWRFPPIDRVPHKLVQSIVNFEDRRFFYHPGIDPLAVLRAAYSNLRTGKVVSGASTLTMQVIRQARKGRPRTIREKLIEMVLALRLELVLDKNRILSLYASHAPFGGNVVGVEAAAWRYFGRDPNRLSWAEACLLAVLPNNPALIHPGRNRQQLLDKRNRLLERLYKRQVIDRLTCRLAQAEPLPPRPLPIPQLAPHLLARFQAKTQRKAELRQWPSSGSRNRFRTTIQKTIQVRARDIIARHHRQLSANGIHNAAALIIEVNSGEVLAYVGNVHDFADQIHGSQVDVIGAPRSTGSILKPLLYAAMLEAGELLPQELVPDIPTRMGGFAPQNYSRTYYGAVPASMALARSLNVPAVRMLQSFGVDRFSALLKQLGMRTLHRSASEYGLSLILGGAEGTLWDLTAIYAGLARSVNHAKTVAGVGDFQIQHPRIYINEIRMPKDSSNHLTGISNEWPLSPAVCWLTLQAMLEVIRPGVESAWESFTSSKKIAWKTGTSYGHRDAWAIGVTPRYAIGVWVGNADGEGRPGLTGIAAAAPVLFELFDLVKDDDWFDMPIEGLTEIEVCAKSGHRAGPNCRATRSMIIPNTGLRAPPCPYCRKIHVDETKNWRVHSECERVASMLPESQFVLPPAMEWYYKRNHADYRSLPPYRSDCLVTAQAAGSVSLSLVYPGEKGRIYVPIELDGQQGRTVFEAAHRNPAATIYWHLDSSYLGATRDIHQMALAPKPGSHLVILVDDNGEHLKRVFTVLTKPQH